MIFPLGALMFKNIEGGEAKEKHVKLNKDMKDLRDIITKRLWNLTCCEAIGNDENFYLSE